MQKKFLTLLATVLLLTQLSNVPIETASASGATNEIEGKLANGRVLIPQEHFQKI